MNLDVPVRRISCLQEDQGVVNRVSSSKSGHSGGTLVQTASIVVGSCAPSCHAAIGDVRIRKVLYPWVTRSSLASITHNGPPARLSWLRCRMLHPMAVACSWIVCLIVTCTLQVADLVRKR